jgi:hypothetical protein
MIYRQNSELGQLTWNCPISSIVNGLNDRWETAEALQPVDRSFGLWRAKGSKQVEALGIES